MKPDYKNWIPKGMLYTLLSLPVVSALLFLASFFLFDGVLERVLCIIFSIALIVSIKFAIWCGYAYKSFSNDGKRME